MINSKQVFWILLILCVLAYFWRVIQELKPEPSLINNAYAEKRTTDTVWDWKEVEKVLGEKVPAKESLQVRITQTESEHIKQWNGSMYAIDIVTPDWNAYFPESHNEYVITHIGSDERLGDYIIIRNGLNRWVYGHTVTSRSKGVLINVEKDGSILGQSNLSGISTAKHTHIERWVCPEKESKMKDCNNISTTGEIAERNRELKEQRGWIEESFVDPEMFWANCTADAAVEEINYAYQLGWIDFVGTIAAESKFDPACNWDHWKSFWYCQIHSTWNKKTQDEYRKLTTNKEKLDFCYKIYKGYLDRWIIQNRLYWYNVRFTKWLPKLNISCK